MISFAISERFSIALMLLVGAFGQNALAELPLSLNTGTLNLSAGISLNTHTANSSPSVGKVLVNNGGTLLGSHNTIPHSGTGHSKAVRSQAAALTMEFKDMTARPPHAELNNSALTIRQSSLPLRSGDFPPGPTNITFIAQNDGTDAVGGTFTTASLLKAAGLRVEDTNGATGLENDIPVEPIPEASTWCTAALLAVFVGFQCYRKFTQNGWQMRPFPIPASKPSQARALAADAPFISKWPRD